MRFLFLAVAAFAGGLLVGALFWPTSTPQRQRSSNATRAAPPPREVPSAGRSARHDDASLTEGGKTSGDTRLGDMARAAAVALETALSTPSAEAFLAGEGTITGTVRDTGGDPVAGVTVTATPEAQPSFISLNRRAARERPHLDRDLGEVAQEAVQAELWRRRMRQVTTSDADGRYELAGLPKGGHTLFAYHDEFDVKPVSRQNKIQPDAVVDFVAQAVLSSRVEVRLPDGNAPTYAWISWRGGGGAGWEAWRPDPGTVRLPLGSCTVMAQAWMDDPLRSAEVAHVVSAASRETPLVLQLQGRRVLTARLAPPAGLAMPESVEFRLRRLEGNGAIDPESLEAGEFQKRSSKSAPGRAQWFDLESGRYLVGAFLQGNRLLGHAVAELGEGSTDVELPMARPDAGSYLSVTLLGPEGGPVSGWTQFHILSGVGERVRYHPTQMLRQADGTWLVMIHPDAQTKSKGAVRIRTEYGDAQESINLRNPGSMTVRFDKPAHVRLRVNGFAGSGVEGRLHAMLWGKQGVARQRKVNADGTCELRGAQPDAYTVVLVIREQDQRWPILLRRVDLRSGERKLTVSVPALHTLHVRPQGRLRGRWVTLTSSDPAIGSLRLRTRPRDGTATFGSLAAGAYEVECSGKRKKIRVPGPEVVVE